MGSLVKIASATSYLVRITIFSDEILMYTERKELIIVVEPTSELAHIFEYPISSPLQFTVWMKVVDINSNHAPSDTIIQAIMAFKGKTHLCLDKVKQEEASEILNALSRSSELGWALPNLIELTLDLAIVKVEDLLKFLVTRYGGPNPPTALKTLALKIEDEGIDPNFLVRAEAVIGRGVICGPAA